MFELRRYQARKYEFDLKYALIFRPYFCVGENTNSSNNKLIVHIVIFAPKLFCYRERAFLYVKDTGKICGAIIVVCYFLRLMRFAFDT